MIKTNRAATDNPTMSTVFNKLIRAAPCVIPRIPPPVQQIQRRSMNTPSDGAESEEAAGGTQTALILAPSRCTY